MPTVKNLDQPADLSEKGAKAHRVLVQYLKLKDLTDTGGGKAFRSPKEWAERGETYGKDSHLIVVYDGGEHRDAFALDNTAYDTVEAMQQQLATVGCFFEECTTWYGAVYSI